MKKNMPRELPSDLFEIFSSVFEQVHVFEVNNLTAAEIKRLGRKACWSYSDLEHPLKTVRFGDNFFSRAGETNIQFSAGETKINYQLKAMALGLLYIGKTQGGHPLKWNSVLATIRSLNVFAKLCVQNHITCFFELNPQSTLKLRTLISEFVLETSSTPITSYDRLNALSTLHLAGIVSSKEWLSCLHDIKSRLPPRADLSVLSHPIVPTTLLKGLIQDSCEYIDKARTVWPEYKQLIELGINKLKGSKSQDIKYLFQNSLYPNYPRASKLRKDHFRHLPLHVSIVTLAFTGMRISELLSIKNHGAVVKEEQNQVTHFVEAWLKKGDDDVIKLDWVSNKFTYNAITLLSDHNHLIYKIGHEIVTAHPSLVPHNLSHQFKHGTQQNLLLGLKSGFSFPRFNNLKRSFKGKHNISFDKLHYPLDQSDIDQLEQLNCNHKHIKGPNRGQPYTVGEDFIFSPHKFRHTFAWLVVTTRLGDIDDIKYQFKHLGVAMTHIYTNRGHEHLSSLAEVIEVFDEKAKELVQQTIVKEAQNNNLAGGGGEIVVSAILKELNKDEAGQFNLESPPHIKSSEVVLELLNQHGGNIAFLTNGVCIRGAKCKSIDNLNSCGTAHCPTFIATTKNLPYWQTVMRNAETQRNSILSKTPKEQIQYKNLLASANKTLIEASKVIEQLTTGASLKERIENK